MADFRTWKNQSNIDVLYVRHCGGRGGNEERKKKKNSFDNDDRTWIVPVQMHCGREEEKKKKNDKLPDIDEQKV